MAEWITWDGGFCPVPPNMIVDIRFRDGEVYSATLAGTWCGPRRSASNWCHFPDDPDEAGSDIVAYRKSPQGNPHED